jgi:hypothetical protein
LGLGFGVWVLGFGFGSYLPETRGSFSILVNQSILGFVHEIASFFRVYQPLRHHDCLPACQCCPKLHCSYCFVYFYLLVSSRFALLASRFSVLGSASRFTLLLVSLFSLHSSRFTLLASLFSLHSSRFTLSYLLLDEYSSQHSDSGNRLGFLSTVLI